MNLYKLGNIYQLISLPTQDEEEKYVCVVSVANNEIQYISLKKPYYRKLPIFLFAEYTPIEITRWLS